MSSRPSVVHHYTGHWSNHCFCHLWGMLTLDVWRTNLLNIDKVNGGSVNITETKPSSCAHLVVPSNAIATLRVYFQTDKRCNVFELVSQPDGSLANDNLKLMIMEVDNTEQRVGGLFVFTGDCPQICMHANSFQATPESMLCDLETCFMGNKKVRCV